MKSLAWLAAAAFAIPLLASSVPATAQERTGVRPGFELASDSGARIMLIRPSIRVGSQSTGGMYEPNADWTQQARENIGAALADIQGSLGNTVVLQEAPVGDAAELNADYSALFSAVANSVMTYQFFLGNRLPTKLRDNREDEFDWSLGPGVSNIPGAENADYALFIFTEDHYGSTGRKILQIFAALGGVGVQSGVHIGYAGLVDLRTGNLLWLNADGQMGGDVRTPEGAQRRVGQLLEEFPGSEIEAGEEE